MLSVQDKIEQESSQQVIHRKLREVNSIPTILVDTEVVSPFQHLLDQE
jgi:hypothetical protein